MTERAAVGEEKAGNAEGAGEREEEGEREELRGKVVALEAKVSKAAAELEEERALAEEAREEISQILDELTAAKKENDKKDGLLRERDATILEKEQENKALLASISEQEAKARQETPAAAAAGGGVTVSGLDAGAGAARTNEREQDEAAEREGEHGEDEGGADSWGDDDWGNEDEKFSDSAKESDSSNVKLTESQKTMSSATDAALSQKGGSGSGASSGDDLINSASEPEVPGHLCMSCQAPILAGAASTGAAAADEGAVDRLKFRILALEEEAQKAKDSFEVNWDALCSAQSRVRELEDAVDRLEGEKAAGERKMAEIQGMKEELASTVVQYEEKLADMEVSCRG
jgi:chromosome segregation ATPase